MKKYIFTESQIKKIIDRQIVENKDLQEQSMGSAVTTNTLPQMEYVFFQDPSLIEKIKKQGLLDWEKVKELKNKFYSGKKELDYKIWYLLMFQMWYERWMKK